MRVIAGLKGDGCDLLDNLIRREDVKEMASDRDEDRWREGCGRGWEVEGERGKAVNSSLNCYRWYQQHHQQERLGVSPWSPRSTIGKY